MNSPASGTTRSERPSTRNGQWQCGDLGTEAYAEVRKISGRVCSVLGDVLSELTVQPSLLET